MDAGRIQFNQNVNQKFGGSHTDGEKNLTNTPESEYEVAPAGDQISILARPEVKKTQSGRVNNDRSPAENGQKEVNSQPIEKKASPPQAEQMVSLALNVDDNGMDLSTAPPMTISSPLCESVQEDHDLGYFIAGEGISTAAYNADAALDDIFGDDPTPYLHSCYDRPEASPANAFYKTGMNTLDSMAGERKIFSVEGYEVATLI